MNSKQAKQIPIEHFLNKLNYKPVKSSGYDLWYKSPLHEDNTPSFKVNKILNSWYDFGIKLQKSYQCSICPFLIFLKHGFYIVLNR